jgi:hypothetical protein
MAPETRKSLVADLLGQTGQDPSAFGLLLANFVTIELAILGRWELAHVMRIYWWQSVIIGAFHFARLLQLKSFHMEKPDESGKVIAPTRDRKIEWAVGFIVAYGWMHFGYMWFIRELPAEPPAHPWLIPLAVLAFGVNHLFSFLHNTERDAKKWRNLPAMVRMGNLRILPMHGTLMLGSQLALGRFGVVIFLVLKTIADVIMHEQEHFMRADPSARRSQGSDAT